MYATLVDMQARFKTADLVQLTDEAGAGVIDTVKVATALTDASDLVDSYLKATYALPLSPVPPVLVQKTCDLALLNLYSDTPPDGVQSKYDAAIAWLKDVAKGVVKLDAAGIEPAASTGALVQTCDTLVSGKRDGMRGFS